jgi:hypothetical protein
VRSCRTPPPLYRIEEMLRHIIPFLGRPFGCVLRRDFSLQVNVRLCLPRRTVTVSCPEHFREYSITDRASLILLLLKRPYMHYPMTFRSLLGNVCCIIRAQKAQLRLRGYSVFTGRVFPGCWPRRAPGINRAYATTLLLLRRASEIRPLSYRGDYSDLPKRYSESTFS